MAQITADRISDTTITTGLSDIAVSGTAPTTFKTPSSVMAVGDWAYFCIVHQTANEWQVGKYTYSAVNTLTLDRFISSSTGSQVSFSAGTKDVFLDNAAEPIAFRSSASLHAHFGGL
jgi:hypothetical protein